MVGENKGNKNSWKLLQPKSLTLRVPIFIQRYLFDKLFNTENIFTKGKTNGIIDFKRKKLQGFKDRPV